MKLNCNRSRWHHAWYALAGVVAFTLVSHHAQAATFELIYNGFLNNQDALNLASQANPSYFSGNTPFTIQAWFDTSSPNLAPPLPAPTPFAGFRAYSPSLATITIGNQTYTMDTFATNPTAGVTVAIFDQQSFTAGRYGIGILQQPPQDGAGIIGDFVGASPNFTVDTLTSTTVFTGYAGVGYGSGVCVQGTGANCQAHAVTPFVLHDSANQTWALTLGNYDEAYATGPDAGTPGRIPGPLNQAQLVATPEPGTFGVAGIALATVFGWASRRRKRGMHQQQA